MYCIYCYTNKITGKKYVGQTCKSLAERAGRNGCHYIIKNGAFGNSIKKYGWESFVPEVLEDGLTLEEANEREQYWISELNTLVPNGYNLASGGSNPEVHESTCEKHRRFRHTEESRKKISESLKGVPKTEEHIEKSRKAHLGMKFSPEAREKLSEMRMGHLVSDETRQKLRESNTNNPYYSRKVAQYSLDGECIAEYPSGAEASRQTGINHSNIIQCCKGSYKHAHAGGYIWKYAS